MFLKCLPNVHIFVTINQKKVRVRLPEYLLRFNQSTSAPTVFENSFTLKKEKIVF